MSRTSLYGNPLLLGAVACELALLGVFLALPGVADVLGHSAPTPLGWALAATVAPVVLIVDTVQKAVLARRSRTASPRGNGTEDPARGALGGRG